VHAQTIRAACELIRDSEESPGLTALAETSGLSPFHFQRVFKSQVGLTPKEFADAVRGEKVRKALSRSETVTRAIYEAGFNSNSRFYGKAAKTLGMAPRKFQAGGKDMNIHYGFGRSSLGHVLVAATRAGVCAVLLGDEKEALLNDLRGRFRNANLSAGETGFDRIIEQAVKVVEEPGSAVTLPLDIRGTVFQQKVWNALRQIPVGQTTNYREIARKIGLPKAVRAVAGACGANPVAVAVPCHRVLRSDGDISGYRWGIQRKRALLEREKRAK
jgi:AraC family transcriptional regulator of adaptative response/methylated-DNA-[protein]-cysteine methyltransferase